MKQLIRAAALILATALPVGAAELGADGLHQADWIRDTFLDLREDLAEANAEGKRMFIIFEQRGCSYCLKMHEEVFPEENVNALLNEEFFVVRLNLHGDLEVTDFDGEVMSEKQIARRWGILFTPTILFMPQEVAEDATAQQAAVAAMPGAFSASTTLDLMTWVVEERYLLDGDEDFQRYHARRIRERGGEVLD